jgi:hypothetical protein
VRRLALAAAAVVAVALAAASTTSAGGDHGGDGRTITVFATTSLDRIAVLPVVPGKFSLGDRVVFSDDLFTARGGTAVGTDGAECTTVRVTNAATASGILQCLVTFSLPAGQITTQALNTVTNGQFATGTQIGAITGGTGRYRDAEGQFAVDVLSETEANITFFLGD